MKQTYIILPGNSGKMECIWPFDNTSVRCPVPTNTRQSTVRNPTTFQKSFILPEMLLLPTKLNIPHLYRGPRYSGGALSHIKHALLSIRVRLSVTERDRHTRAA